MICQHYLASFSFIGAFHGKYSVQGKKHEQAKAVLDTSFRYTFANMLQKAKGVSGENNLFGMLHKMTAKNL